MVVGENLRPFYFSIPLTYIIISWYFALNLNANPYFLLLLHSIKQAEK